jgi:hypothetical protein
MLDSRDESLPSHDLCNRALGDLKMNFLVRAEGWRFVPMHVEMFRGRIADRNKPLGHAPVHSIIWNDRVRLFQLKEHQTNSTFPLLNVLNGGSYDLRGKVKTDFDPYALVA